MKPQAHKHAAKRQNSGEAGATNENKKGELALEREAHTETRTANLQLRTIQALTDTALAHLSLDDLLLGIQKRILEVMGGDNSAILLLSENGQYLDIHAAHGGEEAVIGLVQIPLGKGIAGRIAASRKPMIVDDLTKTEVVNDFLKEKMRSLVGVPLMVNDRVVGVLHVDTAKPHHFTQEDVQLLELVAQRVALAIDHARLYEAEKRARAEAVERASQLEAILEAMPDMVTIYNAQGTMIQMNKVSRKALGPDQGYETLAEIPDAYRLHTLDGEPVTIDQLPVAQALQGKTVTGVKFRQDRQPAEGSLFVSASAAPFYDAQGAIAGAVAIAHDITPLLQAQEQVAESAKQLEGIFQAMGDAVFMLDHQGNLVRANQAFYDMLELDQQPDFSALPLATRVGLLALSTVSGLPFAPDETPAHRLLSGEALGHDQELDVLFRTMTGREVLGNLSGAPLRNDQGEVTGAVLVLRDVTERRLLERRTFAALDALLEMAQTLVVGPDEAALEEAHQPDVAGQVAERLAELTCRVLGCSRVSISVVEPETEVVRPITVVGLSPEQERQWWTEQPQNNRLSDSPDQAAVEQLRVGTHLVYDLRQPPYNQIPNPYRISTMLVLPMLVGKQLVGLITLDHGGPEHHYTSQELDLAQAVARLTALVIERERLLRQREEARANEIALSAANRQMSEFLSIASHELLTPLTSIKAHLQLTKRRVTRLAAPDAFPAGIQPDEIAPRLQSFQEMLERLEGQVDRMNRLVNELLDVSRIQAGKLVLQSVPFNLRDVVAEAVEEQRLNWPTRKISLALPDGPARMIGDSDRIGQVVTNYLTNALKYSPPESSVEVALRLEDGHAQVAVRDAGPGLPPEEQERVWDRFHRAKGIEVQSGTGAGLGLGLYICKIIVERHQGRVGVQSKPEEGSTFWFRVPLAAE
ncbi:MAG TPA: GAF domain-containing protein [Ktedonobacterales bacterium]